MAALVVQPIIETSILRVPRRWALLPADWMQGVGFWKLIEAIQAQPNVLPYDAPYDIEWTFATDPADLDAVTLRHPCDECRDAVRQAKLLLEADRNETVALIQFTQNYVYPIGNVPTEFAASGALHQTEVDLS